jgi:hypothetical protein
MPCCSPLKQETAVGLSDIAAGLLHIGSSEQAFLAEHYLGCVTWKDLCEAADLRIDLNELPNTTSASHSAWLWTISENWMYRAHPEPASLGIVESQFRLLRGRRVR